MNKNLLNRIISFVLGTIGFAAALWLKRSKWTRWVAVPLIIILVAVSSFFYYNGVRETPYAFAAAPTFIQAASSNIGSTPGTTGVTTFSGNTSAGSLLAVCISFLGTSITVSSVTDSQGNNFVLADGPLRATSLAWTSYIYYATSTVGGTADVITATLSSSNTYIRVFSHEFGNVDALDVTSTGQGDTGDLATASVNTNYADEIVLGCGISSNGGNSAGTGYTQATTPGSGEISEYKILSSTSSETAPQVNGGGVNPYWLDHLASFYKKQAATLTQSAYRFRNDDGNETTATWAAAENSTSTFPLATNQRLRAQVNASGTPPAIPFQLEWQKNGGAWNVATTGPLSLITPTFVATGTTVSGTGAVTPGVPSGYAANDLLLIFTESANEAVSNPTGYSQAVAIGTGTAAGASSTRLTVMYKFASASESAPTVADPGNHVLAFMMAIRGVDKTNPFNATSTNADTGNNRSVSITGTTTSVSNTLVIAATTNVTDTATAQYSNWTNASLTSLTPRFNAGTTQGNGGGIGVATGIDASPGSTGNTTATTVTATLKTSATLALAPAAVPDMIIASSPNIVAGAASSTTAQLTAPSPKTTSSFFAGRISEDTNPLPSLTITPNYYTELEWNLQATSTSANGDIFNFRVTNNGTVLDTYSYTPVWIIGSNSPPVSSSSTPIFLQFE